MSGPNLPPSTPRWVLRQLLTLALLVFAVNSAAHWAAAITDTPTSIPSSLPEWAYPFQAAVFALWAIRRAARDVLREFREDSKS